MTSRQAAHILLKIPVKGGLVNEDLERTDVRSEPKQNSEVKEHHGGIQALGDLSSQKSRAQNEMHFVYFYVIICLVIKTNSD